MSRLPFELLLALRYLRPKRTFVSIITLISVLGVTLGVAVLLIVTSVMSGFDHQLREKILSFNAHIKVYQTNPATGKDKLLKDYANVASTIASNANVLNVTPFVMEQVMVETEPPPGEDARIGGPWLRGIDPAAGTNFNIFTEHLTGSFDLSGRGLLVGTVFADSMDLQVGDRVAVYSARDVKRMKDSLSKTNHNNQEIRLPQDYEVRGIFDSGFDEYNASVIVSSLENAQELYDLDDDVDGLMVMVKDPYQAHGVQAELRTALGPNYRITTWDEEDSTMQAVVVEKNVMLYILFFIVIVAAFGITCTLITFVVLKTREIGVLKALGATSRQIMWIFLSQSLSISVFGIVIGTGAGLLAVVYRNPFLHFMRRMTGLELFPASVYGFSELPALIVPKDILIICGGSLLICLLAAAFPVWNAGRLKPVEALRHE